MCDDDGDDDDGRRGKDNCRPPKFGIEESSGTQLGGECRLGVKYMYMRDVHSQKWTHATRADLLRQVRFVLEGG